MVSRVKMWLAEGREVKIFTARVARVDQAEECERAIRAWCLQHIGQELEVTCCKDLGMAVLYDDRCVQVIANTGLLLQDVI